ncbi:kynureninase [Hymenobacter busanensis]|uniref:Kynureninase n=1 Tax=Hymenobacter busanensis TaxID=2607656 RepID=A0A7L5A2E9_9BACT|nr:kynureninase [Hymenobacter busanensis]KAA9331689.1 kynureninase [Hymenobacter busanensis]QHJ09718.1 kynureninase [Hymenobacter busanensis]
MPYQNSLDFARQLDAQDPLRAFRSQFLIPKGPDGQPCTYVCGNSLGLQPTSARAAVEAEFAAWEEHGVEGHFRGTAWMHYHDTLTEATARLVGAKPVEVVVMNSLSVNLHLLLISFYRPTATRYKLLMEGGAFPSDQYAAASQAKLHGLNPDEAVVELVPRPGEHTLRTEDIEAKIQELGDSLALVMLGGVNYYTGQAFDMAAVTRAGHAVGATVGFDLAHAAGNLLLHLHDWDVDFACWCTYKYLNSGPGGTSGVFVHERFANRPDLPRLAGWWGHDPSDRFQMKKEFRPMPGAAGWQLSNAQVFPMAIHKASLAIFDEAGGMPALRQKSEQLTGYLEWLLRELNLPADELEIITPADPAQRGCQLSLLLRRRGRALFEHFAARGIMADWREPNVIRLSPVPLYNSFEDVWRIGQAVAEWGQLPV